MSYTYTLTHREAQEWNRHFGLKKTAGDPLNVDQMRQLLGAMQDQLDAHRRDDTAAVLEAMAQRMRR